MTRRSALVAAVLSALSTTRFSPGKAQGGWIAKSRRRWEIATCSEQSAEICRKTVVDFMKRLELVNKIDVGPAHQENLRRVIDLITSDMEWMAKQAEYCAHVAALYRRAAFRPWQKTPPWPKLEPPPSLADLTLCHLNAALMVQEPSMSTQSRPPTTTGGSSSASPA